MSFNTILPVVTTVKILTGAGVRKMKYFSFDGYVFSPIYLRGLADDIHNGYLFVEKFNGSYCYYDAIKNTIYLKFLTTESIEEEALVVHEATHTMFDFQGKKMTIAESESLAYIAQCMYVQLNKSFNPRNPDDRLGDWVEDKWGNVLETAKDGVFKKGWEIAAKIIAEGKDNEPYKISKLDVLNMKEAVSKHPSYASSASVYTDFNGFRLG